MQMHVPSTPLNARLAELARTLESAFLGKEEVIRLLLISAVAGEHAVLVGPPGTAKSALIRVFSRLLDAKYFEYLLTRRTQSYQRLDLRLDYRKNFPGLSLAAYAEISNLLDRENWFVTADGKGFNYGWTRFPVGGLTLSF